MGSEKSQIELPQLPSCIGAMTSANGPEHSAGPLRNRARPVPQRGTNRHSLATVLGGTSYPRLVAEKFRTLYWVPSLCTSRLATLSSGVRAFGRLFGFQRAMIPFLESVLMPPGIVALLRLVERGTFNNEGGGFVREGDSFHSRPSVIVVSGFRESTSGRRRQFARNHCRTRVSQPRCFQ